MKTKKSIAEDFAQVCNLDSLRRPLSDDEVAALHGNEFKIPLPRPSDDSISYQIEEKDLRKLIYFLIWKRMEREMLDEHFGLIPQFEQQLDGYTSSFNKIFK